MFKKIKESAEFTKVKGIVLLVSKQNKTARNGNPYLVLKLRDEEKQELVAKKWLNAPPTLEKFSCEEGNLIDCTIHKEKYNGQDQYVITDMFPAQYSPIYEETDINDFIKSAPYKAEDMYATILNACDNYIKNPYYKQMVHSIYQDHKETLFTWGAAKTAHHNMKGGLLYHIYTVLRMGMFACKTYPFLDQDLLLSAAILHDIGKLRELNTNFLGDSEYTLEGNLFGHLLMGCELLDKYRPSKMPEEDFLLLKHVIAVHHEKEEWGAITTPKIPEAIALCLIDTLDAKLYRCKDVLDGLEPGETSDYIFGLDTRMYKSLKGGKDE